MPQKKRRSSLTRRKVDGKSNFNPVDIGEKENNSEGRLSNRLTIAPSVLEMKGRAMSRLTFQADLDVKERATSRLTIQADTDGENRRHDRRLPFNVLQLDGIATEAIVEGDEQQQDRRLAFDMLQLDAVEQRAFFGLNVVRGTFCQSSERFPDASREKQCIAMAVAAIAYHCSIEVVHTWEEDSIDKILCYGDKLYTQSFRMLNRVRRQQEPAYLNIVEVRRRFAFVEQLAAIKVHDPELGDYNGKIAGEQVGNYYVGLHDAIIALIARVGQEQQQPEHCPAGAVFTCNSISVAVFVCYPQRNTNVEAIDIGVPTLYVFDSHSRDAEGRCDIDGKACLVCFEDDIDALVEHLRHVTSASDDVVYNLSPIVITVSNQMSRIAVAFRFALDAEVLRWAPPTFQATHSANGTMNSVEVPLRRKIRSKKMFLGETRTIIDEYKLSSLRNECQHCHALFYDQESSRQCCRKGKVNLPLRLKADIPQLLLDLFEGRNPFSKNFLEHIRAYNNSLAMASVGAKSIELQPGAGRSYPVMVIHGAVYHIMADVNPADMQFGSIYYCDPNDVRCDERRQENAQTYNMKIRLLHELEEMIRRCHPIAKLYINMREKRQIEEARCAADGGQIPDVFIRFHLNPTVNRGTHNAPTNEHELGAVYVGNYDDVPAPGELCIYLRQPGDGQSNTKFLSTISPLANSLCYPLLFPKGELGWNTNIPLVFADERQRGAAKRMRLTMREHAYYYIMVRPEINAFNPLHYANMLNQQLMIDWFSRIDGDRTNFIRLNQPLLRADTYAGLIDHLAHIDAAATTASEGVTDDVAEKRVGRMTIMPSSFVGCRRYMESAYQDAMTITAKYGRPSLFITMTCNPKWPEICAQLKSHQHAQDRPDIVVRVFHSKMQQLLHEIRTGTVFRGYLAFVYTVEFQKRGLPHIHLLVYVDEAYRPREPHQVDKIVSAELPDPDTEPGLYERVAAFMIHGPCGEDHKDAGCNTKTPQPLESAEAEARYTYKCSKGFPKPFADATEMDTNGRVIMFRRRRDGRRVSKTSGGKQTLLDNRHIAPYNPYLTMRFNAHINVDIVSNTKSVKYLFKYITKGQDQALITADDRTRVSTGDEVTDYLDTRFLGSCEATWRLHGYELTGKSVTIMRLAVHLPGEKNIVFRDGQAASIVERERNNEGKPSTLEAFFILNQQIQLGLIRDVTTRQGGPSVVRNLLYQQVPLFYTRYNSDGLWKPRVRASSVLARIYTISPRHREKFFLRLLLLFRPSPTSFEDLMTINGIRYETFQGAAIAAGITRSDDTWRHTMEEVVATSFPKTIRKVFCYLLANCEVSNDRALWDQFLPDMMEDYIRDGATHEMAGRRVIRWIDRFLKTIGFQRGISVLNLQVDVDDDNDDDDVQPSHQNNMNEIPIQVDNCEILNIDDLNIEQRRVYDRILTSIGEDQTSERAKCFYMQGCGGTGKTFVYNALLQTFHQRGIKTLAVAFTGIAAALLRGGRTAHNAFKLPVPLDADSTSWLRLGSDEAADLARVRLIVWDEVSMTSKYMLNVVDRLLRDLHARPNVPFGGVCIVLGGDLRQVLPIATSRIASQELCFVNCNAWRDFEVYELLTNMRVRDEPDHLPAGQLPFSEWLIRLGDGELQKEFAQKQLHLPPNTIPLPSHILSNDLASDVFGGDVISSNDLNRWASIVADRAILCPRNDDCDRMNGSLLDLFPGELTEMLSVDTIESENHNDIAEIPTEHLNSLHPKGMPNHRILLKVGIPVMLVRNMSVTEGLMNGTRLIVKAIGRNVITCEILLGRFRGERVVLPRVDFKSGESEYPFVLKRRQFPIKVCFAMTINKAQGQTLEHVGIYLPRTVFAHGQLYVAFSRARRWANVKVCVLNVDEQQGNLVSNSKTVYTQNVVNRPVLHAVQSRIMR